MSEERRCPECSTRLPDGALEGLCPACLLKQGTANESDAPRVAGAQKYPDLERVRELFPQLDVLEWIGQGGMGAIYKARQKSLDRFVALKLLPLERSGGPSFAERFNREARALARLNHPNIVAVHEFGQVEGVPYFLMEYVDGVNLRQLLRTNRLSPRQALEIVPQICDALQYAHDEGIVHRDIKPENVLVDRRGRVKLADFGLAKILETAPTKARLTAEGQVMGTPHYMAPEQVEHPLAVDHRADIYALGVVFYEILTGELPLGKFSPPSERVQVDVRLDEVVLRALEKEPERRYQQAGEVKTAVTQIAQEPRPAATPPRLMPAAHPNETSLWQRLRTRLWPPGGGRPRTSGPGRRRAVLAGVGVFLLIMTMTSLVTAVMERSYCSIARIDLSPRAAGGNPVDRPFDPYILQTEFEKMQSSSMLQEVVTRLHLTERWARRYGAQHLPLAGAVELLRRRLAIRQSRNTYLAEVRCYSDYPEESAEIANMVASVYLERTPGRGHMVDTAEPALMPARPNVPANLALAAIAGGLLGCLTTGTWLLAEYLRQERPGPCLS